MSPASSAPAPASTLLGWSPQSRRHRRRENPPAFSHARTGGLLQTSSLRRRRSQRARWKFAWIGPFEVPSAQCRVPKSDSALGTRNPALDLWLDVEIDLDRSVNDVAERTGKMFCSMISNQRLRPV